MQLIDFSDLSGKQKPDKLMNVKISNNLPETADDSEYIVIIELLLNTYPEKFNYTLSEAAKILGLSTEFLRRRHYENSLKTKKFGDRIMINICDLANYLVRGI